MTDQETPATPIEGRQTETPTSPRRHLRLALALLSAVAIGAGTTALAFKGRGATYLVLAPAPIAAMAEGSAVAVEGRVTEIFGNKFVVEDASGRALVETGRHGERGGLVAKAENVTVQGRFQHGFVHAIAIRHADARTDMLDAPPHLGPAPAGP